MVPRGPADTKLHLFQVYHHFCDFVLVPHVDKVKASYIIMSSEEWRDVWSQQRQTNPKKDEQPN